MANLNYYGYEVNDRLRQVDINRNDIGMTQINVLPVPDGEMEPQYKYIPEEMDLTVEGSKETGALTVSVDGTAPNSGMLPYANYHWYLSPTGRENNVEGIIRPGTYLISLGGSESVWDMPWRRAGEVITWEPHIYVKVTSPSGSTEAGAYCGGANGEIVIPENATEVRIDLDIRFDYFTNVTASCELYPFLRLKSLEDEPFEPYKPDLQTQINALDARVTALEQQGGGYNEVQSDTVTDEIEEVTT